MIKGFLGTLIGAALGGAAIREVGRADFTLKESTQAFIGLGISAQAAKPLKKMGWLK